uniref:Uncharacterized protein n=1 Tax=viral metagenome TaxID=1070528 RepID=A0A6C0EBN9_9ZZZZ
MAEVIKPITQILVVRPNGIFIFDIHGRKYESFFDIVTYKPSEEAMEMFYMMSSKKNFSDYNMRFIYCSLANLPLIWDDKLLKEWIDNKTIQFEKVEVIPEESKMPQNFVLHNIYEICDINNLDYPIFSQYPNTISASSQSRIMIHCIKKYIAKEFYATEIDLS